MLGRFFFFWIKLKQFQITWANILFTIEHNTIFKLDILQSYEQN